MKKWGGKKKKNVGEMGGETDEIWGNGRKKELGKKEKIGEKLGKKRKLGEKEEIGGKK